MPVSRCPTPETQCPQHHCDSDPVDDVLSSWLDVVATFMCCLVGWI